MSESALDVAELGHAARLLAPCRRLLVLAGAGSSADAGVTTFRGSGGLWGSVNPEELASCQGFAQNPERVWEWYRQRRMEIASCQPHPGQRALAMLQRYLPSNRQVLVATTNEDDLLERAGVQPVLHLHGSLFDTECAAHCGWRVCDDADNSWSLRHCPRCGARVRPGSVWFGEPVPRSALSALEHFDPDGCLVVGSSSLVQPVAAIPPELALAGSPVVDINIAETPLSGTAAVHLRGPACAVLPALVDHLTSEVVRRQAAQGADS